MRISPLVILDANDTLDLLSDTTTRGTGEKTRSGATTTNTNPIYGFHSDVENNTDKIKILTFFLPEVADYTIHTGVVSQMPALLR